VVNYSIEEKRAIIQVLTLIDKNPLSHFTLIEHTQRILEKMEIGSIMLLIHRLESQHLIEEISDGKSSPVMKLTNEGSYFLTELEDEKRQRDLIMVQEFSRLFKEHQISEKLRPIKDAFETLMTAESTLIELNIPTEKTLSIWKTIVTEIKNKIDKLDKQPECKDFKRNPDLYDNALEFFCKTLEEPSQLYKKAFDEITPYFVVIAFEHRIEQHIRSVRRIETTELDESIKRSALLTLDHLRVAEEKLTQFLSGKSGENLNEITDVLQSINDTLEKLSKETHEWEPSKWTEIIIRSAIIKGIEGKVNEEKPAEKRKIPTHEKCIHCDRERLIKSA
jgi:hypothetical protein